MSIQVTASSNGTSNGATDQKKYDYDLFTIGAGSGGVRGTRFAAQNYGESCTCQTPVAPDFSSQGI